MLFLLGARRRSLCRGLPVQASRRRGDPLARQLSLSMQSFLIRCLSRFFATWGRLFSLDLVRLERSPFDGPGLNTLPAALQDECPDLVVVKNEGSNMKRVCAF